MSTTRTRSRAAETADRIAAARAWWPLGTHVRHLDTGAQGVITLDHPDRVPCGTTGMPDAAAWSVLPSAPVRGKDARRPGYGIAVHVAFRDGGSTWTAWIRTDYLRRVRRTRGGA
ncbi:hypothetical protein AB0I72_19500 [Nocardiopsis sp. NPDC049922]|uniref:hypothetical protein n=1 Tax=Nocardiopsis sp. NPDC049922 TaxID=3155157 RepID=UPI0033E74EF4